MAYKMATGNGPNIGNVLPTTDPTDPTKKKKEAQAKADQAAASSEKVYGKPTTTSEKTVQDGVRGTLFTTTRPYTQSGTGESTMSYKQLAAKGGDVEAAKKWNAKQSSSGQDVTSRFTADAINLKPMPRVPYEPEITGGLTPRVKRFTGRPSTTPPKPKKRIPPGPNFVEVVGDALQDVGDFVTGVVRNLKPKKRWNSRGFGGTLRSFLPCRNCKL